MLVVPQACKFNEEADDEVSHGSYNHKFFSAIGTKIIPTLPPTESAALQAAVQQPWLRLQLLPGGGVMTRLGPGVSLKLGRSRGHCL